MKVSDISSMSNVGSLANAQGSSQVSGANGASRIDSIQSDKIDQMNAEKSDEERVVIDNEMLEKAVEQANKSLSVYNRYIERSVHEKTKAIMYVMKDSKTDEVVREFPPKKIQDMIAKMWELAGLFVDEKA